ncbi:hypothetical protein CDV50_03325 [Haematobacter massiliensis]|uniref:Uncharacterized protein n=1 Tax=Haematobacter massiliensis TaxID=195105 RepID=A0A086XX33_9RHOB|nr:Gp49 family protein [Haematobacter massiliensis]KFI26583.1 hypothetical protein CN97_02785 [Haematobacter massiliensis]OWJ73325.1 hypothetical protein CDV50_03325 [Haematobacter massiliensis]OWJ86321.1 hypothetical protein CDV51_10320 [Haematobacter massiliensis]
MSVNEAEIEAELQASGKTAPRITPGDLDAEIADCDYHVFPGTTLTICALKLRNGFIVTGESAAASPTNFDPEIGKKIARANARDKLWPLLGFRLRDALASS